MSKPAVTFSTVAAHWRWSRSGYTWVTEYVRKHKPKAGPKRPA